MLILCCIILFNLYQDSNVESMTDGNDRKILSPYIAFISHITVFIILLINKYNIRYYGYGNLY
jgi:hypothetical protein